MQQIANIFYGAVCVPYIFRKILKAGLIEFYFMSPPPEKTFIKNNLYYSFFSGISQEKASEVPYPAKLIHFSAKNAIIEQIYPFISVLYQLMQ